MNYSLKNIEDYRDFVETLHVFRSLDYHQTEILSKGCEIREYVPGTILYEDGDSIDFIGFIIKGKVAYYSNDNELVEVGESFKKYPVGLFRLFNETSHGFTVKAIDTTDVLCIKIKKIEEIKTRHPGIAMHFYSGIAILMFELFTRLTNKYLDKTTER